MHISTYRRRWRPQKTKENLLEMKRKKKKRMEKDERLKTEGYYVQRLERHCYNLCTTTQCYCLENNYADISQEKSRRHTKRKKEEHKRRE